MNNAKVSGFSAMTVFLSLLVGAVIGFLVSRDLMKRRMKKRRAAGKGKGKGKDRKMKKRPEVKGAEESSPAEVSSYMIENEVYN